MATRRDILKKMLVAAGAAGAGSVFARPVEPTEGPPEGYRLVWQDEFNSNGRPNPANWTYEHGFVRNEEFQWYQPENAFCAAGKLIIESRRETKPNPLYREGSSDWHTSRRTAEYTSASLTTRGLHSWQYGYFVMRGRIDIRLGIWPAWWTLGISKPWPACGEIDIMEFYAGHINANVAWESADGSPHWVTTFKPIAGFQDPFWPHKFHLWAMEWTPDLIHLFLDGALLTSVDLSQTLDAQHDGFNPFHQPAYMILNQAIGGQSGGNPEHTHFPSRFEVDYVRVYQQPGHTSQAARPEFDPVRTSD
ncbi:MAG: glycoside hydrolase family 16 protein [Acidobacteria bacterium]|nr:MAG: glycoside hydrolase family 16 protein [Acidobacteriota bacterium]